MKFRPEATSSDIDLLFRIYGIQRVKRYSQKLDYYLLEIQDGESVEDVVDRFRWDELVLFVSPNTLGGISYEPNDPSLGAQWHLDNANGADIEAFAGWDLSRGSGEIVVAILDTGYTVAQPELAGRLWTNPGEIGGTAGVDDDGNGFVDDVNGWDFVQEDGGDNVPEDDDGHGTWVTGVLAANANNSTAVAGVDHFVKFLPVRMVSPENEVLDIDLFVEAVEYVTDFAPDVINMSLQGFYEGDMPLEQALSMAAAGGSILVAPSGNWPSGAQGHADDHYPSAHPDVITVTNTNSQDQWYSTSGTGNSVDFSAPGTAIVTISHVSPYTGTSTQTGGSFASPIVSGILTIMKRLSPGLSKQAAYDILRTTSEDQVGLGSQDVAGWDPYHGHGRVNLRAALASMIIFIDGFETGDLSQWSSVEP